MAITLYNGCVWLPHRPNWDQRISHKRTWQTEIAEALPGQETRQALRAVPRRQITFAILPVTLQERVRFESRLDAALKSGFACAPLHGRACGLAAAAAAGNTSLILNHTPAWNWQAGDYVALVSDDLTFDVAAVLGYAGTTLTLATALNYSWSASSLCWPVIFGKFSAEKLNALTNWHETASLTIAEVTSSRAAQLGSTPAHVPGVGEQIIGSTNTIA